MRKATSKQLRFQFVALFVGWVLVLLGFRIAYLLWHSGAFNRFLNQLTGSNVSETAQLAVSFGVGLSTTALLMLIVYFVTSRRKREE